jgi:glycosyltransferase involved in cell wall biosynthesis
MQLLVITNNPERSSLRQRVGNYLNILADYDINCEVEKLPPGLSSRIKLFKKAAKFSGVFLHKKSLNPIDARLLRRYARKIIYNYDDAIMYSDKNPESYSRSHFVPFRRTVELADMVIVGSQYLADHALKFNSVVKVLPLGLRVNDYKCDTFAANDGRVRLVWIGSKATLKYLAEIKPALEEVGNLFDSLMLRIIGDDFLELDNMPVEKFVWSESTRGIDLGTCDIGLAPLPDNQFTRGKCSFKVLEYSSACLPVVASPVGTNSEFVRDNITGLFAVNIQEWTDRITELIKNPQLRKKMGEQGRTWAQNFDVSVIGRQLADIIKKCIVNT